MKGKLDTILHDYAELLASVDRWFARSMEAAGDAVACTNGCSECCRGLFDITLLDACFLKQGFDRLPAEVREQVRKKAMMRIGELGKVRPDLNHPYILNLWPEEEWEMLMPDEDETPCPLLDDGGVCLVYDWRPMTCRLHGMPLVDVSGEIFHDEWCTMNFTGNEPLGNKSLRWEFRECFANELLIFRRFTYELLKEEINELDTFIPTAIMIDFEEFDWERWWGENSPLIKRQGCEENGPSNPQNR